MLASYSQLIFSSTAFPPWSQGQFGHFKFYCLILQVSCEKGKLKDELTLPKQRVLQRPFDSKSVCHNNLPKVISKQAFWTQLLPLKTVTDEHPCQENKPRILVFHQA